MYTSFRRRIKVLITYTEPLMARGLISVLAQDADLDVATEASALGGPVDVLVADYDQGLAHVADAHHRHPGHALANARVLVLSFSEREQDVRKALNAGVPGFLVLGCPVEEIVNAVHALGVGTRYYQKTVIERVAESLMRVPLTGRETEVLALVTHGLCNKSIARDLAISLGTVKAHVKAILAKLDASSRTHAASIATQRGLVDGHSASAVQAMASGFMPSAARRSDSHMLASVH